ncbi:MAG: hypothetical protein ACLUVG_13285 [Phocaeicola vulgatus]
MAAGFKYNLEPEVEQEERYDVETDADAEVRTSWTQPTSLSARTCPHSHRLQLTW